MPELPAGLDALVDGLDDGARAARVKLVRDLLDSGHEPAALLEAHSADRLALLPITDTLLADGAHTIDEFAARYGVEVADLVASRRALGLPVDRDGAVYGAPMEGFAQRLRDVLDAGVAMPDLVRFNYVIGAGASSIAAGARDMVRDLLADLDPDGDEHSRAVRGAELSKLMTPVLIDVVGLAVGEHLREILRHEVAATITASGPSPTLDVAIVFADLVGFTALGESVTESQLGDVAGLLEQVTRQALTEGCELIKTLGDGVMLASRSADAALGSALALGRAAASTDLPPLRVGIAFGPGLSRAGDWYGSVVNRASRLCACADPGQVVTDATLHDRAAGRYSWSRLGDRPIRGLTDPVACWSVAV